MRLAYFGYDQSALKYLNFFSHNFKEIDFYLLQTKAPSDFSIYQLPIITQNFYIDADERKRTSEQKKIHHRLFENISRLDFFYTNEGFSAPAPEISSQEKRAATSLNRLADAVSINYEGDRQILLNLGFGEKIYDFAALESTLFLKNYFLKSDRSFSGLLRFLENQSEDQLVFLTVKYAKKNKYPAEFSQKKFIGVHSVDFDSVVDNFYLCELKDCELCVDFLISATKHLDSEYINFLVDRVRRLMEQRFPSLELGEAFQHDFYPSQSDFSFTKNKQLFNLPYPGGRDERRLGEYLSRKIDTKYFAGRSVKSRS